MMTDHPFRIEARDAGGGRGLNRGDFADANGEACSIQGSSAATEPKLWLGLNSGTHHQGECLARMHLTREMVRALIPLLEEFVKTGELRELDR